MLEKILIALFLICLAFVVVYWLVPDLRLLAGYVTRKFREDAEG